MAKEKVQEAVVEETEVATAEAEVAEATEETTKETTTTDETADAGGDELSPWYYFFATGCGWCKKSTPVVEALIDDGYDILMLDTAEPDNAKLRDELFAEYNTRCGTPWFINADTGKSVCGFREKDVLEVWLSGEDVPEPPRPTGPPPKVPFMGATKEEDATWVTEYDKWVKDNEHMPADWQKQQRSASAILDSPRPKSDPPRPPMGPQMAQATDADFDKWGEEMTVWQEENKHLPNLQPVANMVQNMKGRRDQMAQQAAGGAPAGAGGVVDNAKLNTMDARVQALEVKIDKLMSHFGVK